MTVDVDEIEGWDENRRMVESQRVVPLLIAHIRELETERDGLVSRILSVFDLRCWAYKRGRNDFVSVIPRRDLERVLRPERTEGGEAN